MNTKQKPTYEINITALSHDGRGIAQREGKTVFIENALPGETVEFHYLRNHSKFDEGKATKIITVSPQRVTPKCAHFEICGGCALQHMDSDQQRALKQKTLLDQLKHFGSIIPEEILPPLASDVWGYRHKARLSVKYVHKKQTVLVGFHEKAGRYIAEIKQCEILNPKVGYLISALRDFIATLSIYQQIPQIEVAITEKVTALVFRHLQNFTDDDKQKLIAFAKEHNLQIYLQPGSMSSIHLFYPENANELLSYELPDYKLELFFQPTDFTQIHTKLNQLMIQQALKLLDIQSDENVLDLFCGIGNFTLPIARIANAVIGVEGEAGLVARAHANALHNKIENANFVVENLCPEETSSGNSTSFPQKRESHNADTRHWSRQTYDKILLDPPRIGALKIVSDMKKFKAKKIVYVSCNPATFARDAGELAKQGYKLKQVGIMDMFPHTHHVETMGVFE